MWVRFRGQEDPLEDDMATHSSIPAWRIPWTEEPGQLQSIVSQRVGHDWSNLAHMHARTSYIITFFSVKYILHIIYVYIWRYMCEHMCLYARYMVTYHVCTHVVYTYTCVCCVFPYVSRVYGHTYLCVLGIYEYMCLLSYVYESESTGTHACILTYTPKSSRWQWLAETAYSLNKEYLSWNWKNEQSWHKKAVFKWEQKTHTWYDQTENSVQLEWP